MHDELHVTSEDALPDPQAEERLRDLSGVVRGLIHDLRNPLNVIRTNLYLLRQKVPGDNPSTARSLNRIDDQVSAILKTLEGISAHYRADEPYLQRVELNQWVRAAVEAFTRPEDIALTLSLEETPVFVNVDTNLLDAALRAVLRNSVKAMGGRGELLVSVHPAEETVQLVVQDTGPGIAAEVLPHVLEPFFTTWEGHAGLGLALVQKIARVHGGRVQLGSEPGGGTRVVLELPVTSA